MFTGGTIWILTHGHILKQDSCQAAVTKAGEEEEQTPLQQKLEEPWACFGLWLSKIG